MRIAMGSGLFALIALAGCAQVEVRDANTTPGGTVTTEDHTKNAALGWIPSIGPTNRPGIDHWTRIRVIAPEGATECRSGSMFSKGGPQARGRPDADRAVMLTSREGDRTAHFVCDTPAGPVRRSVRASVYTHTWSDPPPGVKRNFTPKPRDFHVLPPLVHMDPREPDASARWAAIGPELCPVVSEQSATLICKPGMMEKFRAVDLGEAS